MTLTYCPNKTGRLQAAYSGEARVGYVEARQNACWLWQLSVALGPHTHMGKCDSEQEAKQTLQGAFDHWLATAGLSQRA